LSAQRPAARVLGAALLVALAAGCAIALLVGPWTAILNEIGDPREIAALCLQIAGLYVVVFAAGLVPLAAVALAAGRRPGVRFFAAAALAASVLLNGLQRFHLTTQPLSVTPHVPLVGLAQSVALVAIAGLVFAALWWARGRRSLTALLAAAALLAGMEAFQRWHQRPLRRDVAHLVPSVVHEAPRAFTPVAQEERFERAKLVVLGIDGLGFEVALPLLRRGDMPNLAWLLDRAAFGYLATLDFPISPVIWETISTGVPPERHRIGHHSHWIFRGVRDRIRFLPTYPIAENSVFALRRLANLTTGLATWKQVPHDSTDAGAARLWEILGRRGLSVGSYHWMNTAPVSHVRGFMKGYEPTPPREWPPDLEAGLGELPSIFDVLPYERALWRRFVTLARRWRPEVLLYYTHFADATNHWNWKQDAVGPGLVHSGLGHADFEPGREITEANRQVDEMIGDVLARLPEDATLAIVSDHGFEFNGYEHDHSPPGVILLFGPWVRPGPIEGASVYDVTPTLLHLLGAPVAADMPGRVLPVWRPGSPPERPPETVASYGAADPPVAVGQASEEEIRRTEEYLRSLGYVN
jgi:hypothetical protein